MEYSKLSRYYERWCRGDEPYEKTAEFYTEFLGTVGREVTELGIGNGRVALSVLERHDKHITGVDRSEEMIALCREKYNSKTYKGILDIMLCDFLNFRLERLADCIYMPLRTLGHVMFSDMGNFLKNVRENLKPGGRFIFDLDVYDLAWAREHDGQDMLLDNVNGERLEENLTHDFENHMVSCAVKCNGTPVETIVYRWFDVEEILELTQNFSFVVEKLYGDYAFAGWTRSSKYQIWVLKK